MTDVLRTVRIRSIAYEAPGVLSFCLTSTEGGDFPAYAPGAHIDVHLPNGIARSYSLIGAPRRLDCYEIGVAWARESRGASRWLHECARPGDLFRITSPRNQFVLAEDAAHSVLIGGGIGITPLIGMAQRLDQLGRSFRLYLCARSRADAVFADRLSSLSGSVETVFTREPPGARLDLSAVVGSAPADAHLYCCGPAGMIESFEAASANRPARHIHFERFSATQDKAIEGGFLVELARSGMTVPVAAGKSILDCVIEAGVDVNCSCIQGVCGSCETNVLAGTPDHRDAILSPEERAAGKTMMICCSGAKSSRLTLDL